MKGFVLGLLMAGLLAGGYYYYWRRQQPLPVESAFEHHDAGAPAAKKARRRVRGAMRVARASAGERAADPEREHVHIASADLRQVAQGDDLSKPDVLRLDLANDRELSELTQDQIDERFRAQEGAILACIAQARPDPETYVPGQVMIGFRIQRGGNVRGVRVEAPSILQRNGLYPCIKGVVGRIRFPAAGTSQIISYPFRLT
ncbi:MAG: AgmX/PglI C-terminal domain-containing protein [Polyangia bacterium]|jgi:hypothetical protein